LLRVVQHTKAGRYESATFCAKCLIRKKIQVIEINWPFTFPNNGQVDLVSI
jgi:hypothetical protein